MISDMQTRLVSAMKRLSGFAAARRLLRQQDGAAAIEFGLVAAPFLALVFAIMETAMVFFAGQTLETAAADSARLIMTGQAQTQGFDQAQFKKAVCAKIYGLFNCNGGLLRRREDTTRRSPTSTIPSFRSTPTATCRPTTSAISRAAPATSWSCA